MHPIKFFSESDSVKEVLDDQSPDQHDNTNFLVNLISNVVEWSKWDLDTILNTPFTPMMLIVNSVLKQRKDDNSVVSPSPKMAPDPVNIGAKVLWLQYGIENQEAKKIVELANIICISNKCIKQEYQRLFLKMSPVFPVLRTN